MAEWIYILWAMSDHISSVKSVKTMFCFVFTFFGWGGLWIVISLFTLVKANCLHAVGLLLHTSLSANLDGDLINGYDGERYIT